MRNNINTPDEELSEDGILRRAFSESVVKSINKDKREIEFIISTPTADRYGDVVEVSGWDLKSYRKNPVVLFGHMSSIPPIGKATKVWKDGDTLRAIAQFMPQDISNFAHSIFRMFEEGYLKAVSVGFRPLKYERLKDDEGNETWAYRFLKQELLEFSAVPIPANPEALIAARQKGIDTLPFKSWAEEILDNWSTTQNPMDKLYGLDKRGVENIRRRAAGAGATFSVPPTIQDEIMKKNLESIRAAKNNKGALAAFEVGDVDFELPVTDLSKDHVDTVDLATEEINGTKNYSVIKAGDKVVFSYDILKQATENTFGDFIKLAVEDNAEGEKSLFIQFTDSEAAITYEVVGQKLLGKGEGSDVYAIKVSEKDLKAASTSEDEEDEEDVSEDEDEDEDDKKSKSEASEETVDKGTQGVIEKRVEEEIEKRVEEEVELSFNDMLGVIETCLLNFEGALDKKGLKAQTKHEQRKLVFLAGYMREFADLLDGGEGEAEAAKSQSTVTFRSLEKDAGDDSLSEEGAKEYLKSILGQLQPLLTEMVESKLSKMKGSLD